MLQSAANLLIYCLPGASIPLLQGGLPLLRCPKKSSGLRFSSIFSTAATRSARFICHRQRSHRSPPAGILPHPDTPVHCPLSTVNCPLSTVHCQLSTVNYPSFISFEISLNSLLFIGPHPLGITVPCWLISSSQRRPCSHAAGKGTNLPPSSCH